MFSDLFLIIWFVSGSDTQGYESSTNPLFELAEKWVP